jgi:hypothetical protein
VNRHSASLSTTIGIQGSEEAREFESLHIKAAAATTKVVADQFGCLDGADHVLASILSVDKLLSNVQDGS